MRRVCEPTAPLEIFGWENFAKNSLYSKGQSAAYSNGLSTTILTIVRGCTSHT